MALLEEQQRLQRMPRTMKRFQEYIKSLNYDGDEIEFPPLVAMNPMGKEHMIERVDQLLAIDAESIAREAVADAGKRLADDARSFRHAMVVSDDVAGGWTNRYTSESASIFPRQYAHKQSWITTILWASEDPDPDHVRCEVQRSVYRTYHVARHGIARSLDDMMRQEGAAGHFARLPIHLDEEDLDYSIEVIRPLCEETNYAVCFAAMYGDGAARLLGYTPLGLSERAGFAVGIAEAAGHPLFVSDRDNASK